MSDSVRPHVELGPLDSRGMSFGVLLPHFGIAATPSRVLQSGALAEALGLDAVWVRDHLLWRPHGIEGEDRTFVEPLAVLNAVGAVTSKIGLGTAVLIPVRWPLKLAQDLAALSYLHGPRVIAGLGTGSNHAELAAAGFDATKRRRIVSETVDILRGVWSADEVDFHGEVFNFDPVTILPKPTQPIPLWYGGTTASAARFAVKKFDGWVSGRVPFRRLRKLLELLEHEESEAGHRIHRAVIQLVKVSEDGAAARDADLFAAAHSVESTENQPASVQSISDVRGAITVGNPVEVAEELMELVELGIDHIVFDLRLQFEDFEGALSLIADQVIPRIRKAGAGGARL